MISAPNVSMGKRIWTGFSFLATFSAGVLCERLGFFAFLSESWEDVLFFLWQHIQLVFSGAFFAVLIGVPIGVILTRDFMKPFRKVSLSLLGVLQTVPSLAVLAMVMTWVGIGAKTAVIGLVVYSLLPIIRNTVAGIDNINPILIDAARGMGMTPLQTLLKVELPNAMYIILTGVRTSTVILVGTAALSFLVGGGGLGDLIFTGIAMVDPGIMLGGAIPTAILAIFMNWLLGRIEYRLLSPGLRRE